MIDIEKALRFLGKELSTEILQLSQVKEFKPDIEIIRESSYVTHLPLVLTGLVKVYSKFENRELLLYYIKPTESCIMSFNACLTNHPSQIFANTIEPSTILLIPRETINPLLKKYNRFSSLFYEQYDKRYTELLDTIRHVLIDKMDKRLYDYLLQKCSVLETSEIEMSHSQIANELGTVREVVTRVMKKLESEGRVIQQQHSIKVIAW